MQNGLSIYQTIHAEWIEH